MPIRASLPGIGSHLVRGAFAAALAICAIAASTRLVAAASVSGALLASGGKPVADEQIHFEDVVSHDIYLVPTATDGSFVVDLPPGVYELRGERGAVIASEIAVGHFDRKLGSLKDPSRFNPKRLFEREGIGEAIIKSPAPETSNLRGMDETFGPAPSPAPSQ